MKNESGRLQQCIASLAAQKSKIPFEVHLVDNGSNDGTYSQARRTVQEMGLKNFFVWKEKRPGSPAAFNHGARKARGRILAFMAADCVPGARWVEEISRPLLKPTHYPLAAVSGDTAVPPPQSHWDRYLKYLFDFWERERRAGAPAFLPWVPIYNMAVKTDVFRALKGFDERWKTSAYDIDFSWRLVLCGFMTAHNPKATSLRTRRYDLRRLLAQMERYTYFSQSLLSTYQKELKLPLLGQKKDEISRQSKRVVSALKDLKDTRNLRQAGFRGVDSLLALASLTGAMEARIARKRPDPRLGPGRRGEIPAELQAQLPRGYSHLHREGWAYWKTPADVGDEEKLVLYRPRRNERLELPKRSWRIWEVKSERGQSEDAAAALGLSPTDRDVLHDIDQRTVDLHTRRLLPRL